MCYQREPILPNRQLGVNQSIRVERWTGTGSDTTSGRKTAVMRASKFYGALNLIGAR